MPVPVLIPDTGDVRRHIVTTVVGGSLASASLIITLVLWSGEGSWYVTPYVRDLELPSKALVTSDNLLAVHAALISDLLDRTLALSCSGETDPTKPLAPQIKLALA